MTRMKMRVIPAPAPNARTLFAFSVTPGIFGKGDTDYACGSCDVTLLKGIDHDQLRGGVFKCPQCGSLNEIDAAHRTD